MGSKRFGGVLFVTRRGDHDPRHIHAFVGDGEIIIELTSEHEAVLADRTRSVRGATMSDVRKALKMATKHFDALVTLWEETHGEN